MNTKELNAKALTEYLKYLGYDHTKRSGNDFWYHSPFREERTASFKVNSKLNTWYDFGEGIGGTFVDFGIKYHNCSVSDLLKKFNNIGPNAPARPIKFERTKVERTTNIEILKISRIKSQELTSYLHSRGIPFFLGTQYLCEVNFKIRAREFKAIGFKNNSGGYELRNNFFKGSSSPKDITFIDNQSKNLLAFEGFFDYLSFCVLKATIAQHSNALILNSTALLERSTELILKHHSTLLFFDNDSTGDKATLKILQSYPSKTSDGRSFFKSAKDLNEHLLNLNKTQDIKQKHQLKRNNKT